MTAAAMGLLLAGMIEVAAPARPVAAAASSAWSSSATSGPPASVNAAMAWDAATSSDVLLATDGTTWTWNGSAWTQQNPAHSPGARSGAAMAYDAAHAQVVLFGGVQGTTTLQDTWTWDGGDWTHRAPSNSPPARGGAGMAWDGKAQRVLMFGGFDLLTVFYDDTWEWDGSNWNEQLANLDSSATTGVSAAAAAPSPRTLPMMAEDTANQTIVLFGGANWQGVLDDTWVWYDSFEGGRWIPTTPAQSPPARDAGAFGFATGTTGDVRYGGPVLFGGAGANSARLQDTWAWDGRGWSNLGSTGQPSARSGAAAATGPGGGMVLFGGSAAGGAQADTWTWSGTIDAAPLAAPTIVSCPVPTPVALPTTTGTGTLRGAAAASHPNLLIGAGLTAAEIYSADAEQQITAGSQFNTVVSTNQMYWSATESEPGVFNFCHGDEFVAYAKAYHQQLRLHNLIAGTDALNQSPNWVLSPDYPWTATSLLAVMKQWITTAIDHYRGEVSVYDVVNETLKSDGTPQANVFEQAIGFPRYVEAAFQDAAAANPQGTLLYDDTAWFGAKLTGLENLVADLRNTGTPIDAVGFEMNGEPTSANVSALSSDMATFAAAPYSVKTAITQMTVPYTTEPPDATTLAAQANVYSQAMSACLAPASNCFLFNVWGVSDTYGLPTSLVAEVALSQNVRFGGTLFDETYQPRPAFATVLGLLQP